MIESTLDAGTHKHLHFGRLGTDVLLKLLSVVFRTSDVCANLQQSLHVLEVFAVRIFQTNPNVFHLIVLLEIDGGQIVVCKADELVLNPASVQDSDGNVCVLCILGSLQQYANATQT